MGKGRMVLAAAVVALVLAGTPPAEAAPPPEALGTVTLFNPGAPGARQTIIAGGDGFLYFVTDENPDRIGRFHPSTPGTRTYFGDPDMHTVADLLWGPDGHVWATDTFDSEIVELDPTTGTFQIHPAGTVGPFFLATDGTSIYYTASGSHARQMSTSGALGWTTPTPFNSNVGLEYAPDGFLYGVRTATNGWQVTRVNPANGAMTDYRIPPAEPFSTLPSSLAIGPDGNVWVTASLGDAARIVRFRTSTNGFTTFTNNGMRYPNGIAAMADGNLWFTSTQNKRIGRITPAGAITMYPSFSNAYTPSAIVRGPDGNGWFLGSKTLPDPYRIGRVEIGGARCDGRLVTVDLNEAEVPTAGNDVILGTGAGETINGLGGKDVICGGGGADTLNGGPGDDRLLGAAGNDTLNGSTGKDVLNGGPNRDTCNGGPQQDTQSACEIRTGIP